MFEGTLRLFLVWLAAALFMAPVSLASAQTKDGISDARNELAGYIVVNADSIEAAARLFDNHPHFTIFPGDAVDIMPFLTDPAD